MQLLPVKFVREALLPSRPIKITIEDGAGHKINGTLRWRRYNTILEVDGNISSI